MIVEEKKFQDENNVIGYYEGVYDSSNILKTTYFPQKKLLYISFNRGGVYSYANVDEELYEEFKNAESQGKFFAKTIKSQPNKYSYRKEFTLYPEEVKELKEVVETHRKNEEDDEEEVLIHVGETEDDIYEIKEEENGVVELLKRVLNFYGNKDNYKQNTHLNEELTSMIELDEGEQARQVLGLVDSLQKESEKMEQDYEKIMEEELKNAADPEKMKSIINSIKKGAI